MSLPCFYVTMFGDGVRSPRNKRRNSMRSASASAAKNNLMLERNHRMMTVGFESSPAKKRFRLNTPRHEAAAFTRRVRGARELVVGMAHIARGLSEWSSGHKAKTKVDTIAVCEGGSHP